jgi:hypothetical protein
MSTIAAFIKRHLLLTYYALTFSLSWGGMLLVWVYDRTDSLLVAVLMHASLIVSTTPILLPTMTGVAFLTWFIVLTVAFWAVVLAVAAARLLSWQPIRLRPV